MDQLAKRIADIPMSEVEDHKQPEVDEAARRQGEARAKRLSPERRSEIARKAATARWENEGGQ